MAKPPESTKTSLRQKRPHRLAHPAAPDGLTRAPTSSTLALPCPLQLTAHARCLCVGRGLERSLASNTIELSISSLSSKKKTQTGPVDYGLRSGGVTSRRNALHGRSSADTLSLQHAGALACPDLKNWSGTRQASAVDRK